MKYNFFHPLYLSFLRPKVFSVDEVQLIDFFSLLGHVFDIMSIHQPWTLKISSCFTFFSKSSIALCFTFQPMTYFELLLYKV